MRKALEQLDGDSGDDGVGRRQWLVACLGMLLRRPHDTLAAAAGFAALATILANALFLQAVPHPAPLFAIKVNQPAPTPVRESTGGVALPRPRPADIAARTEPVSRGEPSVRAELAGRPEPVRAAPARSRAEIVTDIQRELARRGLYDGPVDGMYGGKTDAAIRLFEKAAGLPVSGEASEAILKSITRMPVGGKSLSAAPSAVPHPEPAAQASTEGSAPQSRGEPGGVMAPRRVRAVQQALSDFGYGQVKPTGTLDAATRAAIETFEKVHKLPITGQISEQFLRELVDVTDRPIE